ncbi:GNAT family N-acetyltransferase [Acidiferrimicrobium sp. IK]|uniref:GNAT family N-acetyltransferase n=1 Tax=Acidiferrimicrobium sp. IK TaxID=2871700 RepID=UPI0021CB8F7A|nr:GNAT family N-acetyltransferase [Acidiferrimicrobium sp. IK]MCU4183360.1 GNAT family N-acetyltransferase [Acidiferrimicrobium sp. IK]
MEQLARVEWRAADAAVPPAATLIEEMILELVGWYGRIDGAGAPSATPGDFAPPGGIFLVGWADGEAVAGGGVKRWDADTGEIKRMYVVAKWRGQGLAGGLLAALEDAARGLGYRRVRLDTGRFQPVAQSLYERRGYLPIPDYNANPHASFWGEKQLL